MEEIDGEIDDAMSSLGSKLKTSLCICRWSRGERALRGLRFLGLDNDDDGDIVRERSGAKNEAKDPNAASAKEESLESGFILGGACGRIFWPAWVG